MTAGTQSTSDITVDQWQEDRPMPRELLLERVRDDCVAVLCLITDTIDVELLDVGIVGVLVRVVLSSSHGRRTHRGRPSLPLPLPLPLILTLTLTQHYTHPAPPCLINSADASRGVDHVGGTGPRGRGRLPTA